MPLPPGRSVTFGPYTSPTIVSCWLLLRYSLRARPWSKTRTRPEPPGALTVCEPLAAPLNRGGRPLGHGAATTPVGPPEALHVKNSRMSVASALSEACWVIDGDPVT